MKFKEFFRTSFAIIYGIILINAVFVFSGVKMTLLTILIQLPLMYVMGVILYKRSFDVVKK